MKHITTLKTRNLCESAKNGGCGECQTSCQSACKTSCGIANQKCESNYADPNCRFFQLFFTSPKIFLHQCFFSVSSFLRFFFILRRDRYVRKRFKIVGWFLKSRSWS